MNDNKVELLGWYGSDQVIAQSAWTSTTRDLTPDKIERIPNLVVDLWANGHETPYEKCNVHFLVDTEIASHIHLLKHRISHLNGESARYKELKEDKYYLPEDWGKTILQIDIEDYERGTFAEAGEVWTNILKNYTELGNSLYHQAIEDLTPIIGRKRAKESARFFKTYNSQIQADVQFNLRSFANFLKLRNSEHAQKEIREVAQQMHKLVLEIDDKPFKFSLWVIQRANEIWESKRKEVVGQLKDELKELLQP